MSWQCHVCQWIKIMAKPMSPIVLRKFGLRFSNSMIQLQLILAYWRSLLKVLPVYLKKACQPERKGIKKLKLFSVNLKNVEFPLRFAFLCWSKIKGSKNDFQFSNIFQVWLQETSCDYRKLSMAGECCGHHYIFEILLIIWSEFTLSWHGL